MTRDHEIESLLRQAGARVTPSSDRTARVRAAAQQAWQGEVRARRTRVWLWAGCGAATIAASLFLVTRTQPETPPAPVAVGARVVVGQLTSVDASVGTVSVIHPDGVADPAPASHGLTDGEGIRTSAGATASVALAEGGELRVAPDTIVVLETHRHVRLERGTVYLDSQGATPGAFVVSTPSGAVRDIGTRFEVHVDAATTRIRVREGAVQLERSQQIHRASAGNELALEGGRVVTRAIAPFDLAWNWVVGAAPEFRIEGVSLDAFLKWAEREGGLTIDKSTLAPAMRAIKLHGSIAGLSVQEALTNVLPTCGLSARIANGRVSIRSAQ